MATDLTIHIGPPKTASSTIQATLAASRRHLLESGVLYPTAGVIGDQHLAAAADLALQCGLDFTPSAVSRGLFANPGLHRGAWQELLDQTEAHPGPVIWSSECFTYLGPAGVQALARAVAGTPTRVVMVGRRPSQALASGYSESIKRMLMPPFEAFVRERMGSLADGQRSEFDYLDRARLRDRWGRPGLAVAVVPAGPALTDDAVRSAVRTILPPGVEVPLVGQRNVGLSAMGIAAWRAHMHASKPRYGGAVATVLDWFCASHPAAVDPALGGRLAFTEEAAALIDAAFAGDSAASTPAQAREDLRAAVAGPAPLTRELPGSLDATDPAWRTVVAALPARQRRANATWALIDAGSAALGRRRPWRLDVG